MALLVPDEGEVQLGEMMLGKDAQEDVTLKLYTNDMTPAEANTSASYTEASGNGYAAKTLVKAGWTVATATGVTTASYAQQTFAFTGALGNVYGYYAVGATSGKVLWAERFTGAPFNIQNNGDEIKVPPQFTLA